MDFLERDEHLRRLGEALATAGAGRGRIFAISGEAGAGKTTLVERFTRDHAPDARVYFGACENLTTPEPLLPLRDIARASGAAIDVSGGHLAAFEAVLGLLAQPGKPALMVLEDMHWADAATIDLIRFLGRRIGRVRALVLITYRDEEVGSPSALRDVLGEAASGVVERMTLEPLSLRSVAELAAGKGRQADELFALTGGNPFMVTEALAVDGDTPPETVRDATLARAARLPAAGRLVLEAVSIFPRKADPAIVSKLVGDAMEAGLDACIEKGMLVMAEGMTLKFRHELARRAIEGSLSVSRLRNLHQRTIDALKASAQVRASEMAHHAERAGDVATLLDYAQRAAADAARTGANREAASHYAAMLRHRDAMSSSAVVDTLERYGEQSYLMGDSHAALSSMLEASTHRRKAGEALALGRDLTRLSRYAWVCGQRVNAERFVREAITVLEAAPPGPELAWAYSHQAQLDMLAQNSENAIAWGQRAIELAEQLGEQEIIIHALGNVGTSRIDMDGTSADADLRKSMELARKAGFPDHVERAYCNLTCSYYWRRDYRGALELIKDGADYACDRDLTHWESYLRGWRAMAMLDQGDWAGAEAEAQLVSGWTGVPDLFRFPALTALARVRLRRGDADADEPLAHTRRLAAGVDELQRSMYVAVLDAEKAWLSRSIPDPSEPRSNYPSRDADHATILRLHELHNLAIERGAIWVVSDTGLWLHLLEERLPDVRKLAQPFRDQCQGRWREAAKAWRAMGCPYEEAIALSGGDEEGQREALAIFDRLGAAPAAAKLRRQMRAAGVRAIPRGPIAGTRANPAGLTRRQAEVLNLVGAGLSNAEIADKLCISAKTAEHHVSALMARLDVATRREAAAEARKLGILESAAEN
ncbi:MAG TPA: AAA family ATPase [Hyphomonadaceae bacterium]|nr:AAA family ATPase [Hyphomonadaceae bacterium]